MKLNETAIEICEQVIANETHLGVCTSLVGQSRVVDFGVDHPGSLQAGIELARICTAGLAEIAIVPSSDDLAFPILTVRTDHPLWACMASQYAGWPVSTENYFAMGSGPIRAVRGKELLLLDLNLTEAAGKAIAVLETATLPTVEVCHLMAEECGLDPANLTLACAPTSSISGTIQIIARSIETALHKMFELDFDISQVRHGFGSAPMPPIGATDVASIGLTNDSILYGGEVVLLLDCDDEEVESVGEKLPSCSSPDYGKAFHKIFAEHGNDFYKIDPMLFSPAVVTLINIRSGKAKTFGQKNIALLKDTFFQS